jgi:monoamine oxidase
MAYQQAELIEAGLMSLADVFGLAPEQLGGLWWRRAINWLYDPFARGAYSYATTETRAAQSVLSSPMVDRCSSRRSPLPWERQGYGRGGAGNGVEAAQTILATSVFLAAVLLASK